MFPIADAELKARVELVATEAGAIIEEVPGDPVPKGATRLDDTGTVGYLQGSMRDIASLYAHLSGRGSTRLLDTSRDASEMTSVDVVIGLTTDITVELMEALAGVTVSGERAGLPGDSLIGLIAASDEHHLRRRAVLTAAALFVGPARHCLSLVAGVETSTSQSGKRQDETDGDFTQRLGQSVSLLVLNTHCDGIDAYLANTRTLCPFAHHTVADTDRAPYCAETGFCHRQDMHIDRARRENRLITPGHLKARVMLFSTCQGAMPSNPIIDSRHTLISGLMDSLGIVAILTTWEICIPPPTAVDDLFAILQSGATVGESGRSFNRASLPRKNGVRLGLFGDPRLTVAPGSARHPAGETARTGGDLQWQARLRSASFLRAYLSLSIVDVPEAQASLLQRAQESVLQYEYVLWRGSTVEGHPDATGPRLREAVLAFLAARGASPYHAWMRLAQDVTSHAGAACKNCGRTTEINRVELRLPSPYHRLLVRCPLCGIVAEGDGGFALTICSASDRLALSPDGPTANWSGLVHVSCQREDESIARPWPRAADGSAMRTIGIPNPLPPGPLRISAVMMEDANLNVASLPTHGAFHPPA